MIKSPLDLDAVQAFVQVAELSSFTRAAEAMQTTQSAVSLKLKRLEERLECKLIERTPRYVRLSPQGQTFLEHARELLRVHEKACASFFGDRQRMAIGISDHVAGSELPALIGSLNRRDPNLLVEVRIETTTTLLRRYDRRELDTVIVRMDTGRDDGVVLTDEKFGWYAAHNWQVRSGEPVPLAVMPPPCGVRHIATNLLDETSVPWTEVFVGGGVAAVSAAVMAGLGVAALARRMLPLGVVEVSEKLGLPELPRFPIIVHSRIREERQQQALNALTATFKSALRV